MYYLNTKSGRIPGSGGKQQMTHISKKVQAIVNLNLSTLCLGNPELKWGQQVPLGLTKHTGEEQEGGEGNALWMRITESHT